MAKELPYFQFEPAEYLTKDISFCSLTAQGLFINLCAYYWQRECKLTKDQLLRRLNYSKELNELIQEKVISVKENDISVNFLDEQYKKATKLSNTNKINGSKGGRPKKKNPIKTETKAKQNRNESESKGIREDKRKRDKIKVDKTKEQRKADFEKSLLPFLNDYKKEMLREFSDYWCEFGDADKKLRWEKQTSFSLKRRLTSWHNKDYNKHKNTGHLKISEQISHIKNKPTQNT